MTTNFFTKDIRPILDKFLAIQYIIDDKMTKAVGSSGEY